MDFKVVWTDPALADLQDIVAYIARDHLITAERVGNNIIDHVETLRTFPFIGPPILAVPVATEGKSFVEIIEYFIEYRSRRN